MTRINTLALAVLLLGCVPHPTAYPISSSHSALTATDYDLAEAAFSGGLAPMPDEWAAIRCQDLLDRRDTASAFVLGLTGLGGAGGLATLIPKDAPPDEVKRWDLGLGISTLAVATTATILGALVHAWSAEFERECNTEKPAAVEHPASDEDEPGEEPDGGTP